MLLLARVAMSRCSYNLVHGRIMHMKHLHELSSALTHLIIEYLSCIVVFSVSITEERMSVSMSANYGNHTGQDTIDQTQTG